MKPRLRAAIPAARTGKPPICIPRFWKACDELENPDDFLEAHTNHEV
jgi:hypothetical protein